MGMHVGWTYDNQFSISFVTENLFDPNRVEFSLGVPNAANVGLKRSLYASITWKPRRMRLVNGIRAKILSRAAAAVRGYFWLAVVWSSLLLSIVFIVAPGLHAQQAKPTEYQVKAAYLYNFTLFVSWPHLDKASNRSFDVCVLGTDPFGAVLDSTFAGETFDGRAIRVQRITDPHDASGCRILFISQSEDKRLADIISSLDKAEALTVSDISDFSERGGMIQFVWQGDNVRFEVNLQATNSAGLVLSSDLLKIAASVRGTPSGF